MTSPTDVRSPPPPYKVSSGKRSQKEAPRGKPSFPAGLSLLTDQNSIPFGTEAIAQLSEGGREHYKGQNFLYHASCQLILHHLGWPTLPPCSTALGPDRLTSIDKPSFLHASLFAGRDCLPLRRMDCEKERVPGGVSRKPGVICWAKGVGLLRALGTQQQQ